MFDDLGRSLRLGRSGAVCRPLRRGGRRFPLGQPRRPAIPACRRDPSLSFRPFGCGPPRSAGLLGPLLAAHPAFGGAGAVF